MKKEAIRFFNIDDKSNKSIRQISRELTESELRNEFIDALWDNIDYWETISGSRREILEGVIFSTLTLIDGSRIGNGGYYIIPKSYQEDIDFDIINGNNYRPIDKCINNDLHLHDYFYSRRTN